MNRDALGVIDCACEDGFHVSVRLHEVREGDVIHLAGHHPMEVFIEETPDEGSRYTMELWPFAWRGEGAEGICSRSPDALIALAYRP